MHVQERESKKRMGREGLAPTRCHRHLGSRCGEAPRGQRVGRGRCAFRALGQGRSWREAGAVSG